MMILREDVLPTRRMNVSQAARELGASWLITFDTATEFWPGTSPSTACAPATSVPKRSNRN